MQTYMKFKTHTLASLTNKQQGQLPTEKEIQQYQTKGWHISPIILPDELLDSALSGAAAFHAGKRDVLVNNLDRISNDDTFSGSRVLNNEMTALQKNELRTLVNSPMIAATAAVLARSKSIRLFADALVWKKPRLEGDPGVIGWHADRAYWPTCTSTNMLTAWVPFQDCTIEMSPVSYITNSHRWKEEPKIRDFFYRFRNPNLDELNEFLKEEKPDHEEAVMTLKKGQVSFHHGYTLHGSRPNTSQIDRVAMGIHFQDESNIYQRVLSKAGETVEIGYDKVCRKDSSGLPDYSDPNIFPTLFRFN